MRTGRPTLPALLVVAACHANSAGVPVPPGPTRAPAVHVQGNELVDSAGRPVRLRGVNRSGAEYACAQGWGIFDGPSDSPSVSAIVSWRTNVVRLPLNETCWLGINGVTPAYAGANYQQAIADYVARLNHAGLVVILVGFPAMEEIATKLPRVARQSPARLAGSRLQIAVTFASVSRCDARK